MSRRRERNAQKTRDARRQLRVGLPDIYARRNSSTHLAVPALVLSTAVGLAVAVIAAVLVPATPNRVSARPD